MKESNLIFLISQPRSGSSLVQQLILSETKIASAPEPWQMLNLISTYYNHNIRSSYNPRFAVINFNRYLESIENGLSNYKSSIKDIALDLYNSHSNGLLFFLDKTPRYYHIIDELVELFPKAKFIFLTRNPLSVFTSILDYNFKGDLVTFLKSEDRLDDLFVAPKNIYNAIKKNPEVLHITYENVIHDSEQTLKIIFDYLQFETPTEINYSLRKEFRGNTALDTKSLHKHSRPVKDYLNGWKKSIDTSQKQIAALGYLKYLKSELPDYFEYDLSYQINQLKNLKPLKKNWFNLSFRILSNKEEKLSILDFLKKRIFLKIQRTLYK